MKFVAALVLFFGMAHSDGEWCTIHNNGDENRCFSSLYSCKSSELSGYNTCAWKDSDLEKQVKDLSDRVEELESKLSSAGL